MLCFRETLRIFVTGDNHIGLKYASHKQSTVLASNRLTTFESMVQAANQESCDLFVITGDLFENTYSTSKKDIKALLDMFCYRTYKIKRRYYHENQNRLCNQLEQQQLCC